VADFWAWSIFGGGITSIIVAFVIFLIVKVSKKWGME
jgi:hypothetical protein